MKPITTSVFTFDKLIEGGYVYVDKTARLYDLVSSPYGVYFLDELEQNFAPHIEHVAAQRDCTTGDILHQMREWYNGYRFSEAETGVYNPVLVGRFLDTGKLSNYWFETGTPSFLIKLLKSGRLSIPEITRESLDELAFSANEVDRVSALPLLFQTGYLTIRDVIRTSRQPLYRLDYPNMEVREAFSQYLVESYTNVEKSIVPAYLRRLLAALESGDMDRAMQTLRIFFADIPYDIQLNNEKYYQTIFFVLLRLLALDVDCEVRTEAGRSQGRGRKMDGRKMGRIGKRREREGQILDGTRG